MPLVVLEDGTGIHCKLSRLNDDVLAALNEAALGHPNFESLTSSPISVPFKPLSSASP